MHSDLAAWRHAMQTDSYAPATVRVRVQVLTQLCDVLDVAPRDLTETHVRAYLAERELTDWSRLSYLQHVRAFAAWAKIDDPTEGIRRPRYPRNMPRPVTDVDVRRLLAACGAGLPHARLRCWILLAAYAGLRVHEIAGLRGADVDAHGIRVRGKGGRVDVVPLHPLLAAALEPFTARTRGRLWDVRSGSITAAVRRHAGRCGVNATPHRLRHWFGTTVHRTRGDLLLTQALLRHSSPTTTAGYAAVANDAAAAVVADLPDLGAAA